jgi:predicted CoA-binding protein
MLGRHLTTDAEIRALLSRVRTVAVVGLSPKPFRDSHRIAVYLQQAGYRVIPVHPAGGTILGETVFPSLEAIPAGREVDLIDVFRRPEALPDLVAGAVSWRAGTPFWFQLGVVNPTAEAAALTAGSDMVIDRCILVEHRRLLSG